MVGKCVIECQYSISCMWPWYVSAQWHLSVWVTLTEAFSAVKVVQRAGPMQIVVSQISKASEETSCTPQLGIGTVLQLIISGQPEHLCCPGQTPIWQIQCLLHRLSREMPPCTHRTSSFTLALGAWAWATKQKSSACRPYTGLPSPASSTSSLQSALSLAPDTVC